MPRDLNDDDLDKLVYGPTGKRPEPTEPTAKDKAQAQTQNMSMGEQFGRGVGQAFANIPEVPLYYAEKGIRQFDPSFNIVPQAWRQSAKEFRDAAENTPIGIGGEIAGSLLSGSAEIGALSKIPAIASFVSKFPRLGSTALGSIAGLWSRPAETPKEAIFQAATGGLVGGATTGRSLASANRISAQQTAAKQASDAERQALIAASRSAAGHASRAEDELNMARAAWARETDPAIRKILEARVAAISQRSGQASAAAKAAAEDASRRPFGQYEHIHEHVPPGVTSFLSRLPTSLKHLVAHWLITSGPALPQGAVPSVAGNISGRSVEDSQ